MIALAVLASSACRRAGVAAKFDSPEEHAKWPHTIDEAVDRLLVELSAKDKQDIAAMKKEDLIDMHFGLGLHIRNEYGLWRGNDALLRATGQDHPDEASGVILEALWERLRTHP